MSRSTSPQAAHLGQREANSEFLNRTDGRLLKMEDGVGEKQKMTKSELRSRWINANGVRTHYIEVGDDAPVLLALHGGGHGSSGHSGMGPILVELGNEMRALAPDSIGGYGETDVNAPTPLGLLDRVNHTRDFVEALCLDHFAIMGNSQGAFAAARYALQNPHRVEKLIMVGTLTVAQSMGIEQAPTSALKALMSYDGTPEAMRRMLEGLVKNQDKITDELIARRQASATRPGAMEAMDRFLKATGGLNKNPITALSMNMREVLPKLTSEIPTICIWGEDDPFSLPETGRKLEAVLPDVKFHWIRNAGHQVQTDQPEAVAKVIRDFVLGS
jgi:pimeloyl-ACP methyl ester carboxylesterase